MKLFVFGLGYSARHFVAGLRGARVVGTSREARQAGTGDARVEILAFDGAKADPAIEARLAESDVLLVSIPPSEDGDPVLARFAPMLAASSWRTIVYLSTIGVYGDHGGAWVDETSALRPSSARNRARVEAEQAWLRLGREIGAPVHLLRLAGIYGPGRNALVNLREGRARRIVKPGQVFNRIHVEDIAQAIGLAIGRGGEGGVWNVADDEPAPPQDVIAFAAGLLGVTPPREAAFDTAEMTPMARSFYGDNKRISNAKLKNRLGFAPLYPTYREGLRTLAASGEGAPA
ncbi:MAG TPA: SDR family oxidoreductase [Roseiarcus sp.]|nr:SDR family oxidoreductase [Roseiarcus sp.]